MMLFDDVMDVLFIDIICPLAQAKSRKGSAEIAKMTFKTPQTEHASNVVGKRSPLVMPFKKK